MAYLVREHGQKRGDEIIDEIDRRCAIFSCLLFQSPSYASITRIAATPAFPGLRNFPQGRNFTQWTGDDSKGLMKVFA